LVRQSNAYPSSGCYAINLYFPKGSSQAESGINLFSLVSSSALDFEDLRRLVRVGVLEWSQR